MYYAQQYGCVVRLKGGDPFVFGRGYEEVDFLRRYNIEASVIPGISSAIAAPSSAGIPVTHRGMSRGFMVLTATQSEDQLNHEIVLAAKSATTLVILMGIRKLSLIVNLCSQVMSSQTPIAIIWNGTTEREHTLTASLDTILSSPDLLLMQGHPGMIVIGDVVNLTQEYQQTITRALRRA